MALFSNMDSISDAADTSSLSYPRAFFFKYIHHTLQNELPKNEKKGHWTTLFLPLTFFNFSVYYHAKLQTITETHIQTRKLRAVSVFVSYPPFFNSIFRQANTSFSQNRQYPTPFYLFALYYHGNPWLLPDSILLPDSTIFSPIAILSAASKTQKKRGPPTTPVNPSTLKNPWF